MQSSTVAAISTPIGEGGIGVIRISGPDALAVADRVFVAVSGRKPSEIAGYTALYGRIYDGGEVIDEAVLLVFRAPKSYTGENVAEISVHGGRYVTKRVLRAVLAAGAQSAAPGEFTKRAFLNGKMDLTMAESVMGIISAQSESELKISAGAVSGRISGEINEIKQNLVHTAASIAAYADYPDEDLPELSEENFGNMLESAKQKLKNMLDTFDAGRILREGIDTVIVGKPNVGKSTLMNLLSGARRSIVTEIAGTTRDIIEDSVMVGDIMLKLSDTAGIHDTSDAVEAAGIALAKEKIDVSELVLAVFDLSSPLDSDDMQLLEYVKDKKTIVVLNKNDSEIKADTSVFDGMAAVYVSAKNGIGTQELIKAVEHITKVENLDAGSTVLSSERQRDCAEKAYEAICGADTALKGGQTLDAVGVCIDDALSALYSLTGERAVNTVTDEIFKRFCVGK